MFIIALTYKKEMQEIERFLDEHIKFLDEQYSQNRFIFSGRKNPRTGGVILAHNATRAEVEELIKLDPFYQHALADYEITEVIPTKYAKEFAYFVEK